MTCSLLGSRATAPRRGKKTVPQRRSPSVSSRSQPEVRDRSTPGRGKDFLFKLPWGGQEGCVTRPKLSPCKVSGQLCQDEQSHLLALTA